MLFLPQLLGKTHKEWAVELEILHAAFEVVSTALMNASDHWIFGMSSIIILALVAMVLYALRR